MNNLYDYKISVVIPTHNRANLISNTIKCVVKQTCAPYEIIIVDDCSTDNTRQIVNEFNDDKIRYILHQKNLGATAARNTGIKAAKGDWIAFLDSDDEWVNTKLEEQISVISTLSTNVAVIHCGLQYVDFQTGKNLSVRIAKGDIKAIARDNIGIIPQTSTMLVRKEALFDVGLFDETLPAHQESELGLRLLQKFSFFLVNKVLVKVTRNHEQITTKPELRTLAKEIILNKHEDLLSNCQKFNFCNIIVGHNIVNGNLIAAKKYLIKGIKYKFNLKHILVYILIIFLPNQIINMFQKKYKKLGII